MPRSSSVIVPPVSLVPPSLFIVVVPFLSVDIVADFPFPSLMVALDPSEEEKKVVLVPSGFEMVPLRPSEEVVTSGDGDLHPPKPTTKTSAKTNDDLRSMGYIMSGNYSVLRATLAFLLSPS